MIFLKIIIQYLTIHNHLSCMLAPGWSAQSLPVANGDICEQDEGMPKLISEILGVKIEIK